MPYFFMVRPRRCPVFYGFVMERSVQFESGGVILHGLMEPAPGERAVVVTHPHPLYGGDMHNNVVEAVVTAYGGEGYGTLRFDFSSVRTGRLSGDRAEGEQQEVGAALAFVDASGATCIDLVGYSFGAWVNALALPDLSQVGSAILISPPVRFLDFASVRRDPRVALVITGSEDDFAPPHDVKDMVSALNPAARLEVVRDADHFFHGYADAVIEIVRDFLR
jgi:alpha/beta superfamily hydrolase